MEHTSNSLRKSDISRSAKVARANWRSWKDVFEHVGPISENPLLTCSERFAAFCNEYSVHRTIKKGTRDDLRVTLKNSPQFEKAIHDCTGQKLVTLEKQLKKKFGTLGGKRGMVSVLSKVAAFVKPERFVAWDRYGKRGVNRVLGRGVSLPFATYADYLNSVNRIWKGKVGRDIKTYLKRSAANTEPAFQRRVLDVYLMKFGDRKL
jgi:hypothetical protein